MFHPVARRFACAASIAISLSAVANADSEKPNQALIDEKERLTAEKDVLTAQTEKLKAELELLKTKIPSFPAGKDGTIAIGTNSAYAIGAVGQIYERLNEAADHICKTIQAILPKDDDSKVVLLGSDDPLAASQYLIVEKELEFIEKDVEIESAKPAEPAVKDTSALGPILTGVLSITKMFRADVTLHNETSAIDSRYLRERAVQCLSGGAGEKISYPALEGEYKLFDPKSSSFITRLSSVVTAIQTDAVKPKADNEKRKALVARIDRLVTGILTPPAGEKHPPLVTILRGEAIKNRVSNESFQLTVEIAQQGGLSTVSSSIWRSDRLFVGGGAIVIYRLTRAGKLYAMDSIRLVDPQLRQIRFNKE